ncbi:MAG: M20/M25/M40 family metallo-hydrolase, partial [Gemmatimonadota bacterium]|nr:M20/M25/M40 family metallo-hydrolase [Gemmatimonadota bacterium]
MPYLTRSLTLALFALLAAVSAPAVAQESVAVRVPASHPRVQEALAHLQRTAAETTLEQISLCEIPAPPFKEALRAEEYRQRMEALGLQNVRIDAEGNVIGERPGEPGEPVVVISGHLDTVFPEGTEVTVRREGTVLHAPGIGDDCRGLMVVLAVAEALNAAEVQTRGTLLFVGTVGEEGEGNLRGVRHLFGTELKDRVDFFISVDGTGLDFTKDAVGSNRYRVTYRGPGGHSYGAFGMPNPMHALGRAIARISEFRVPSEPKVTFSVGVVEGGTSVNSIAASASMLVDMRSLDPEALARLDAGFQEAVQTALNEENARWESPVKLTVAMDTVGIRPAGTQPEDARIVAVAREAGRALGFQPTSSPSSTDA